MTQRTTPYLAVDRRSVVIPRVAILLLLVLCLPGLLACRDVAEVPANKDNSLAARFELDNLQVQTSNGETQDFAIYVARSPEQQRRGLMFVRQLPDDHGMLFVYDDVGVRSMWMKNTYIPLDLVFIAADGRVSSIIHNAEPLTLTSRASEKPVLWVLELNGGIARRHGIQPGSRVFWHDD